MPNLVSNESMSVKTVLGKQISQGCCVIHESFQMSNEKEISHGRVSRQTRKRSADPGPLVESSLIRFDLGSAA